MRFLSPAQCSEWLAARGLAESPYGRTLEQSTSYARFKVKGFSAAVRAAIHSIASAQSDEQEALLQVHDWSSFETKELPQPLGALWATRTGEPSAFWSGDVAFTARDALALEACCLHLYEEGMSGYLYSDAPPATLYLWEGDLIDLWSPNQAVFESLRGSLACAEA